MAGILTHEQKQLAFRLRARGWRFVDIAREIGCTAQMVGLMVNHGRFVSGVEDLWEPRPGCLGIADREEILVGVRAGESLSAIARGLGRVPSVVTREVAANGGRACYSAWAAHQRARDAARRPKPCKLRAGRLLDEVTKRLTELWSPDEIARRLPLDFPDDPEMRVSHETIYQSLYVQGRVDPRQLHDGDRDPDLLLRPTRALAARIQREHQRAPAPVPAQGHRPLDALRGRPPRDPDQSQQPAAQDPRIHDTIRGLHAGRCCHHLNPPKNLMIAANCVEAARQAGVERIVILGSSCIYPSEADQPMSEDALLTGPLELTNEGYAIAKIAALELGKMYRRQYGTDAVSLMPTNLYGPGDNFDLEGSHVLPALLRKIHDAEQAGEREVEVWGTGTPRREFLHADDMADGVVFATKHYTGEQHLNLGVGQDISIRELAELIADVVGWDGELVFNTDMPDGTPRKLMDVSRMRELGWEASTGLREGIEETYEWFLEQSSVRGA